MHLNGIRCSAQCVTLHYVNKNLYLIQKHMFFVIIAHRKKNNWDFWGKFAGMEDQQSVQKSNNHQYDTLARWDKQLIYHAPDVQSIIF